jgi:hypothetical protein
VKSLSWFGAGAVLLWATLAATTPKNSAFSCRHYLQKDTQGNSVGVASFESLMGRPQVVIDVSNSTLESKAKSDPGLNVVQLGDFLVETPLLIGFGLPNVFTVFPAETASNSAKFAAKSLWRGDAEVVDTRGKIQSGILLLPTNLPPEAQENIFKSAQKHAGTRRATCVNSNCRVWTEAGFTVGGQPMDSYYMPFALLRDILDKGLEYKGQPVEFDLIRTTPEILEDAGLNVRKAVYTTLCRHTERACAPLIEKARNNTYLARIKQGYHRTLGVLFSSPEKSLEEKRGEELPIRYSPDREALPLYTLNVSAPTKFGALLRLLWGPHILFEMPLPAGMVQRFLNNKPLRPFPGKSPDFATRIKKRFLFSPVVVKFIRSQLAKEFQSFEGVSTSDLYDVLRTDSENYPNKYNFVVTSRGLTLMKIGIKMKYVDWILSKHVLNSGYAKDVHFAGEFWKGEDGSIYVNGNSGTYKPTNEDLTHVVEMLQEIFPQVHIVAQPRKS